VNNEHPVLKILTPHSEVVS